MDRLDDATPDDAPTGDAAASSTSPPADRRAHPGTVVAAEIIIERTEIPDYPSCRAPRPVRYAPSRGDMLNAFLVVALATLTVSLRDQLVERSQLAGAVIWSLLGVAVIGSAVAVYRILTNRSPGFGPALIIVCMSGISVSVALLDVAVAVAKSLN